MLQELIEFIDSEHGVVNYCSRLNPDIVLHLTFIEHGIDINPTMGWMGFVRSNNLDPPEGGSILFRNSGPEHTIPESHGGLIHNKFRPTTLRLEDIVFFAVITGDKNTYKWIVDIRCQILPVNLICKFHLV